MFTFPSLQSKYIFNIDIYNPDSVLFHIYWLFFLKRAPLYAWGYVTSTHCQPYDRSSAKLQHKQPKVIIVYLGTQQMSEIGFKQGIVYNQKAIIAK